MQTWQGSLEKIDEYRWRIPKTYMEGMRVPGVIYADRRLLESIKRDRAPQQVANVAKDLQRLVAPAAAPTTNDVSRAEPETPAPGR